MWTLYILLVTSEERDEIEAFISFGAIDMTGRKNLRAILYFTALYFGSAVRYCVCRALKNYKSYHFVLCRNTKLLQGKLVTQTDTAKQLSLEALK